MRNYVERITRARLSNSAGSVTEIHTGDKCATHALWLESARARRFYDCGPDVFLINRKMNYTEIMSLVCPAFASEARYDYDCGGDAHRQYLRENRARVGNA